MNFIKRSIYGFRLKWYDLKEYSADLLKFTRHHKFAIAGQATGKLNTGSLGKKVAVVAIYPTSEILFSIRNICSALSNNGYAILLISSSAVAPRLKEELLDCCSLLFERFGFGRDFGSYAAAINWLDTNGELSSLESLVLANDSMFWPTDFTSEIKSLDSSSAEWKCLFEHLKFGNAKYHAQSFFLMFDANIINHVSFRKFWANYVPWSARGHAIHQGEMGLSRSLTKAGFYPHVAYGFPRIWNALLDRIKHDELNMPLKSVLIDMTGADFIEMRLKSISLSDSDGIGRLGIRDQMFLHAIDAVSFRIHETNPTHEVGLLCNVLLKAPIKRDICSRFGKRIGLILATANGFDKGDLENLDAALRVKGSRAQYSNFENFLLSKGRL